MRYNGIYFSKFSMIVLYELKYLSQYDQFIISFGSSGLISSMTHLVRLSISDDMFIMVNPPLSFSSRTTRPSVSGVWYCQSSLLFLVLISSGLGWSNKKSRSYFYPNFSIHKCKIFMVLRTTILWFAFNCLAIYIEDNWTRAIWILSNMIKWYLIDYAIKKSLAKLTSETSTIIFMDTWLA
jgi:hypothetical protein